MKKYFCNACNNEIKALLVGNFMTRDIVLKDGLFNKTKVQLQVGIDVNADDFNICSHCLLDEVYKIDTRPEYRKAILDLQNESESVESNCKRPGEYLPIEP
jgi:hypothetical protein